MTLTVTDGAGNPSTLDWLINVALADVKVPEDSQMLPDARVGAAYTGQIVATGGTGRYGYVLSEGQLPDGLDLNADTGAITGTPTKAGSSEFSIKITDVSSTEPLGKAGGTTIYSVTPKLNMDVLPAEAVVPMAPTPVPSLGAMALVMLNAAALILGAGVIRRKRQTNH